MTQPEAFEKIRDHLLGYMVASSPSDFGYDEEKLNAQEQHIIDDMMDYVTDKLRTMTLE